MPTPSPAARCRVGAAIACLLLSVGLFAGVAAAHATLVSSTPANDETVATPPREVVLNFDERVSAAAGDAVSVLGPSGHELRRGSPGVTDDGRTVTQGVSAGGDGTHTVSYRVASEDGHVVAGSFVFHVGRATSAGGRAVEVDRLALVLGVVSRTLAYAGSLLAVGALAVALWVDRRRWPPRRLWIAAAAMALAGSIVALVALSAELSAGTVANGLRSLGDVVAVFGWRTGPIARVVLAAAFLVATALPRRWRWTPWGAAALSVAVLVLPALSGHASATSGSAELLDIAHLLGAAVWVGGLTTMVLTWRPDRDRLVGYSRLAGWSALVVVASGAVGAWWQLGGLGDALSSTYGRVLAVKLAFVAAVLFFGWVHRRWLSDAALSVAGLVRSLRVEVVLVVVVVVATAVLVNTRQPAPGAPEATQVVGQAGTTTMRMQVVPATSGPNDVHLYFLAIDGSLRPVEAAELRVSSSRVEARRVPLTMITPSHATATGVNLTPGEWRFEVTVVVAGQSQSTTLEVPVR